MPWGNRARGVGPQTIAVLDAFAKMPKGTSPEIAKIAKCSSEYVRTVLRRNGVRLAHRRKGPQPKRTTPKRRYHRLQEWEREAVAMAYKEGEKLIALATEFGVDESTVSRVAESYGFARRSGPTVHPRVVKAMPKSKKSAPVKPMTKREYAMRRREVAALRQSRHAGEG